jgi:hypothetical protein
LVHDSQRNSIGGPGAAASPPATSDAPDLTPMIVLRSFSMEGEQYTPRRLPCPFGLREQTVRIRRPRICTDHAHAYGLSTHRLLDYAAESARKQS